MSPNQHTYARRWDKGDLTFYYAKTYELLQKIHIPKEAITEKCDTFNCAHWRDINSYYNALIFALNSAANSCIPLVRAGAFKSFW